MGCISFSIVAKPKRGKLLLPESQETTESIIMVLYNEKYLTGKDWN